MSQRKQSERRWLPQLALVVLSLIWGYTWVMAKEGLDYAPPLAFAAQRSIGGALALLLVLKWSGRPLRMMAPGSALAIGLVQVAGFTLLQTWALVEGGAGKTAVLIYTMPIWTLLLAWWFLDERIRGTQWMAAATTLAGLLLIIEPWDLQASPLSKLLGVLAALCWAIGTILVKRLRARQTVDLLNLTTWQMVVGAVVLAGFAAVVPEPSTRWSPHFLEILGFMSVASTALCWWLWIYILDRVPAWEASLSVLGTPVVALLSSRWLTDERFRLPELLGIALIGSGLVLLGLLGWAASRRSGVDAISGRSVDNALE
ncbi:MAG: EamA family transporter [Betaproteobacteria bacterium]|nr:EamA family transporter [Betaproteobacteria bacterium]MDE2132099.1 EamA family transporter [Betaproteobacteria bacterium]MDE2212575.1 EamA family transporter [Betaproteobacteria bacterium]